MALDLKLNDAKTLSDRFEIVKEVVRKVMKTSRAGLTLGLAEMGGGEDYWIGAFVFSLPHSSVVRKDSLSLTGAINTPSHTHDRAMQGFYRELALSSRHSRLFAISCG